MTQMLMYNWKKYISLFTIVISGFKIYLKLWRLLRQNKDIWTWICKPDSCSSFINLPTVFPYVHYSNLVVLNTYISKYANSHFFKILFFSHLSCLLLQAIYELRYIEFQIAIAFRYFSNISVVINNSYFVCWTYQWYYACVHIVFVCH